jgi:hypothetical protein
MNSEETAARWRTRIWRDVDRMQRERPPELRLVPGTAAVRPSHRRRFAGIRAALRLPPHVS